MMKHKRVQTLVLSTILLLVSACSQLNSNSMRQLSSSSPSNFKTESIHNPTVKINGIDAEVWGGIATTLNDPNDDLRPGFGMLYNQPNSWSQTAQRSGVVGFFVEAFAKPGIDLVKLAQAINNKGLKVETGPMGLSSGLCDGYNGSPTGLSGATTAAFELYKFGLQKWKDAGGRIDYFTLDDPINFALQDAYSTTPTASCNWASVGYPNESLMIKNITRQLAQWAVAMHAVFPEAKMGITEMEGAYKVTGLMGEDFEPTGPTIYPAISLESIIATMQESFKEAGDNLDYFMVDFPSSQIAIDGVNFPSGPYFVGTDQKGNAVKNNYGRVAAMEQYIHRLGLKYTVYINEDPGNYIQVNNMDQFNAITDEQNNTAAQYIVDRASNYLNDVIKHSIAIDAYSVDLWSPLPKNALPETTQGTQMNVVLQLMNQVWSFAQVSNTVAQAAANQAALAQSAASQAAQALAAAQAVAAAKAAAEANAKTAAAKQAAALASAAAQAAAAQAAATAAAVQAQSAAAQAAATQAANATSALDQANAAQAAADQAAAAQAAVAPPPAPTTPPLSTTAPAPRPTTTVYRYVGTAGYHRYAKTTDEYPNLTLEGAVFSVYQDGWDGTVGLFRCHQGNEYFLSTDSACEGSTTIDMLGWIDATPSTTDLPLYRFDLNRDWLETTDASEGISAGYQHQTLLGGVPQ